MYLYLKEDLFNENFKDLLQELNEIDLFRYALYSNIRKIDDDYSDSEKIKKEKVKKYIEKNLILKQKKK